MTQQAEENRPAMANHPERSHLDTRVRSARPTGEAHRVTTFELFFDLVYVFAVTQVTHFMAEAHSAHGVLQGLLILALLWWTWGGHTWLGNQARAMKVSSESEWSPQWQRCSWSLSAFRKRGRTHQAACMAPPCWCRRT